MSLLLDALKKAAEQKAAKTRDEESDKDSAKDSPADASAQEAAASGSDADESIILRHQLEDETELDHSELDTRLERTRGGHEDGTETGLDAPDSTETPLRHLSEQMKSGEDETLIFAEDEVAEVTQHETPARQRSVEDETDLSQLAEGEDQTGTATEFSGGDETDLSQLAGGEDQTGAGTAFSGGDETDLSQLAEDEDQTGAGTAFSGGDETDLSQLAEGEDQTGAGTPFSGGDETDLSQVAEGEDQTGAGTAFSGSDETDLSQLAGGEDQTGAVEGLAGAAPHAGEDTEIRQPGQPQDQTGGGTEPPGGDETDISMPSRRAGDLEQGEARQREQAAEDADSSATPAGREDDTGPSDDDMSLLLVEREQTQLTSPSSATDPQRPQDALQALRAEAPSADDLGMVENTRNRLPDEDTPGGAAEDSQTGRSDTATTGRSDTATTGRSDTATTGRSDTATTGRSDTATTGIASPTRTTTRATLARGESTATHTYAPDNYDRTLMRLPNDDASRLFAGMKSDSDVVMTPDYAKQVFRSKSSVQRMQHYKIYGGIAIVILLAISVYGVFEYQAESESIDTSLRPLKYDPMPGIIRSRNDDQEAAQLFAEGEVDERALEIIQSAQDPESQSAAGEDAVADQAPAEQPAEAVAAQAAEQVQSLPKETVSTGAEAIESVESDAAVEQETSISGTIASAEPTASGASAADSQVSSLQIKTAERIEEKQLLLREAYDAYQSGNDTLALERYNQVLELDPANRNALLARAAIRVQNGNALAAIEDYQALLLANPKDSLAMASLLAVANYSPGESETQLKLMIRDEPESPYLNFALANAYGAQNRWQEAQGHYYLALQNNPDDPNYAYNLAVSLEHISQPQAAISYYRRALENYNKGLATFSREVVDRRLEKLAQP